MQRKNLIDLITTILIAALVAPLTALETTPISNFILFFITYPFFLTLHYLLLQRTGFSFLYSFFVGLLLTLFHIGEFPSYSIPILTLSGIFFTITRTLLPHLRGLFIASILATTCIPLLLLLPLTLQGTFSPTLLWGTLNLLLISFILSSIGTFLSSILWYFIRSTKIIIKYAILRS